MRPGVDPPKQQEIKEDTMLNPDTQSRLELVHEKQARLRLESWLDRLEETTARETSRRRSRRPLERLWRAFRPAARAS
jgi:hypothetical protein